MAKIQKYNWKKKLKMKLLQNEKVKNSLIDYIYSTIEYGLKINISFSNTMHGIKDELVNLENIKIIILKYDYSKLGYIENKDIIFNKIITEVSPESDVDLNNKFLSQLRDIPSKHEMQLFSKSDFKKLLLAIMNDISEYGFTVWFSGYPKTETRRENFDISIADKNNNEIFRSYMSWEKYSENAEALDKNWNIFIKNLKNKKEEKDKGK